MDNQTVRGAGDREESYEKAEGIKKKKTHKALEVTLEKTTLPTGTTTLFLPRKTLKEGDMYEGSLPFRLPLQNAKWLPS